MKHTPSPFFSTHPLVTSFSFTSHLISFRMRRLPGWNFLLAKSRRSESWTTWPLSHEASMGLVYIFTYFLADFYGKCSSKCSNKYIIYHTWMVWVCFYPVPWTYLLYILSKSQFPSAYICMFFLNVDFSMQKNTAQVLCWSDFIHQKKQIKTTSLAQTISDHETTKKHKVNNMFPQQISDFQPQKVGSLSYRGCGSTTSSPVIPRSSPAACTHLQSPKPRLGYRGVNVCAPNGSKQGR